MSQTLTILFPNSDDILFVKSTKDINDRNIIDITVRNYDGVITQSVVIEPSQLPLLIETLTTLKKEIDSEN